jgi:phosphate transport system substrate-binding protein
MPSGKIRAVIRQRAATATILRTLLTAVLALPLGIAACGGKEGGQAPATTTIQMKGSDTLVNIAQAWAEEYKRVQPSVDVEVSGGGSGVGIAALERGAIDIATASRNMKAEELEQARKNTGKQPREFIVGYDALAVYVNGANGLSEITEEQLAGIFAEGGTVTRWSDIGITIEGVDDDTIVRVSRQSSSGTYEFFREHMLRKKDFKLGSRDMNGSKEVVELVGSTRTAIGYSGMGYATAAVKMLRIAKTAGEPAYAPSIENTLSRKYPLARSLQLYTLGEPEGAVRAFVDWILSPQGQKILEDNGFVSVPANGPAR